MKIFKKRTAQVSLILLSQLLLNLPAKAEIQPLNDEEMSQQTGQAAFYPNYITPSGTGGGATPSDFGFFTLGMNADVSLNTNIQHVQLGCGGANGPGCDIDINNLSLSGNPGVAGCPAGGSNVASCDAVLKNPFMRLAIKNPTTLATRQVIGLQLGAQNVLGLLQAGTNSTVANGINTMSGYMKIQSTSTADTLTGTISTAPAYFPIYNPAPATGPGAGTTNQPGSPYYAISGLLNAYLFGGIQVAQAGFTMNSGGFWIPGFSGINFSVPGKLINDSRVSQITVNPTANLPNMIVGYTPDNNDCGAFGLGGCNTYGTPVNNPTFLPGTGTYPTGVTTGTQGGPVGAVTTSCSGIGCLTLPNGGVGKTITSHLYGTVSSVSSEVSFTQPLGFVHSIPINSPLYLSLQSQNVAWPGAASDDIAKPGWWMSMKDPVLVGNLTPSAPINLCPDAGNASSCVFPQFAKQFNDFLSHNVLGTSALGELIFGSSSLGVQFGNLAMTPIGLNLNGVQLSTQNTVPNCYGSLKFC